jgi:hypothetical protein
VTPAVPAPGVAAALLAFRGIFYLLPLATALAVVGTREAFWRRPIA